MKLGEIKIESLYLCFATPELCIDTENDGDLTETVDNLKYDSNYSDYLNASVGAINRCLAYFELAGVIPERSVRIPYSPQDARDGIITLDLDALIPDFAELVSVREDCNDLAAYTEYARTGSTVRLLPPVRGDGYTVTYRPRAERITHSTPESYDLPLPRNLCELIPYFVKGDIMRVDDADEAERAMEVFEALCQGIPKGEDGKISKVRTVYGMV